MISFSRNTSLISKLFEKPAKQQLKLIYTYSHTEFYSKSVNKKCTKRLLGNTLHKHWLQDSQMSTNSLIKNLVDTKFVSNMHSLRSIILGDNNSRGLHQLYCTSISYNSNRLLLSTLTLTSNSRGLTGASWKNYSGLNASVLHSFLRQLSCLRYSMSVSYVSYISIFTYQNLKALQSFNTTTSKLISSTKSHNTLPLIFHNIRYL